MGSNLVVIKLGQKYPNWEETVCPRPTNRERETSQHPKTESSGHLLFSPAQTPSFLLVIARWFYLVACQPSSQGLAHDLSWASQVPSPRNLNLQLKVQGAYSSWQQCPKNFPFVFVPWSSPQPSGWSFLRPVYLTFLQLLCAAPCHSSKFLFYHWVSLHNFCVIKLICLNIVNCGEVQDQINEASSEHRFNWASNWSWDQRSGWPTP